jgi:hypothetical protein
MTTHTPGQHVFDGLPVLIGSLPLDSHETALTWILEATPEIPLWPQLPVHPLERMLPQFAEGIPCITEENPAGSEAKIYFNTSYTGFDEDMLAFYEEYLTVSEDLASLPGSRFTMSRERAAGLYLFVEKLGSLAGVQGVKGQVTGPFTMLTGIKDTRGRAGYFDETVRDMVVKSIAMKAAWQTQLLKGGSDRPVLLFIDEPALAGLGSSAFIGVTAEEIQVMINEVAEAIHRAGGLAGIHVCANTDWGALLNSKIDILSFDAYGFFDRIAALKKEVDAFFERGGILAWGGVPTSREEDIQKETTGSLADLWHHQAKALAGEHRREEEIFCRTLITPSCGTGSLAPELARKVLDLTRTVSATLRSEFAEVRR